MHDKLKPYFIVVTVTSPACRDNARLTLWALDLNLDVWINITPGPQPRIDHQAMYDPQSRRMIIYGGDAWLQGKFHDLWELQIQPDLPAEGG